MKSGSSSAPLPRSTSSGRLRPDKQAAIMTGGREVFARSGFARASIDAIASAAGVSTRTIYKHFSDKAALFAAVIADSAARVAEDETALIAEHLADVTEAQEVQQALLKLATAWLKSTAPTEDHRTLMGQVHGEAAQLDPTVVTAWWHAGPGRVLADLAAALEHWDEAGLLSIPEPDVAAIHYSELVSAQPGPPGNLLPMEERAAWIGAGVTAFVRAYQPQPQDHTRRRTRD